MVREILAFAVVVIKFSFILQEFEHINRSAERISSERIMIQS
jgi:hypothetical protein